MQLALFAPPAPSVAITPPTSAHAELRYEYLGRSGVWWPATCHGWGRTSKAALLDCRRKASHTGTWRPVSFQTTADGAEGPAGWLWHVDDKHNPEPEWLR
jgi:hypothetical protein